MLSHLELRLIGEVMLRNFNASGAQPTTQKFAGDKWEHHLQCNILSYAEFVSVFLQLRGAHPATLRRFRWPWLSAVLFVGSLPGACLSLRCFCAGSGSSDRWFCRQTGSMHA